MFQENTRKYLRGCYGRQRIYLLLLHEKGREPIGHLTTCIKKTTGVIKVDNLMRVQNRVLHLVFRLPR
ncbi:hypothetical protein QE152_g29236 [Popillia japonica]|uniref:Uncharacterized protein n=1 Tax=Popillia japonica TaxID=7064 RepID=A0AAW1JJ02_POPJA